MNYQSLLIVCLATLGLAVAGWGQVVTSSDGEAWVVGDIRRLTDVSGDDWGPSWSPDGRHIAFVSNREGNYEIYVMGSDGSNPRRLTDHPAEDRSPSWSPDGRHIAFDSNRDGDWEIYVMDIAFYTGREPTATAKTSWGQIKSLLSIGTH